MYDGDTLEHNGREYRVTIEHDIDHGAPWEEEDGHGPVSDWTTRAKEPGEIVLCEDRGSRRYYDFAKAVQSAKRDGWGFLPGELETKQVTAKGAHRAYTRPAPGRPSISAIGSDINRAIRNLYAKHRATMSAAEYAAGAAMADYDRLRRWCEDQWHYVGVVVETKCDCCGTWGHKRTSLWGIESDAGDYMEEVARELAEEIDE